MKITVLALLISVIVPTACNSKKDPIKNSKADTSGANDTAIESEGGLSFDEYIDSLKGLRFDTSTIEGKANKLVNDFDIENCQHLQCSDGDTLLDLNYDGIRDLVIFFHAQSGTGLTNRVEVYLYHPKKNKFIFDDLLSNFSNPSFYLDKKMITYFYIGHGGGGGSKYRWENKKWVLTHTYQFEPSQHDTIPKWEVTIMDNKTGKERIVYQKDNFVIPDKSILPNDYD